ncbi:replication endonuclease [Aliarcobacter cryaerophilus]|uniref:replication endonuclease n=1 Tax=Aliarcobacter cryaerophilus TaxID=28198 RepID=UPI0021B524CB|nr:replication endonuclease [Aliarcobacter cryaerophilus]MCT7406389.1 replication endonuclease [Aliarcobacter cryaerophilus]
MLKEKPIINISYNNPLVLEYKYLIRKKYQKISEVRELKSNRFLSKCIIKNVVNDEIFTIKQDVIEEFNETKNLIYLKCKELERITKEEDLEPIFVTLTNPSEYHPFITSKDKTKFVRLNEKFNFLNIEDSIDESYINVNKIFREFYKNVKKRENKEMKFIKMIEPHRSLICHLHRILYIKKGTYLNVQEKFERIKEKFELEQCKLERLTDSKGSSYIIKYLLKNNKTEDIRKFDGYKKNHNIRIFTMSNLPLSTTIFKKLYYSNKELNLKIIEDIKNGVSKYQNLYHFYTKNTEIKEIKQDIKEKNLFKFFNKNNKKMFLVFKKTRVEENEIFKKDKKLIEEKFVTEEELKKLYFYKKDKGNKIFYKIKEKIEDYVTGENIYFINIYKKIKVKEILKVKIIEEFSIFNTIKNKEIYNKNNFKLIKMI